MYEKLNLDQVPRPHPPRLLFVLVVVLLMVGLLMLLPSTVALCLEAPVLVGLTWVASFGMEDALDEFIRFQRRAQKLFRQ